MHEQNETLCFGSSIPTRDLSEKEINHIYDVQQVTRFISEQQKMFFFFWEYRSYSKQKVFDTITVTLGGEIQQNYLICIKSISSILVGNQIRL